MHDDKCQTLTSCDEIMYCFARSVFVQWCARDVQLQRSWLVFGIFALDFVNFVVVKLMAHSIDGNDIREAK